MITAVIITRNEEEVIEDCLKSLLGFADKVIVIDADSTDDTVGIAKKHKAHVTSPEFSNFSEQRNFALKQASSDWIYYIDADERVTPEFKKEAQERINGYIKESNIAGFFVRRKTFYFGRDWGFTDQVQRLFYREKLIEWFGVVHESPKVKGEMETISSPILHFTHRNLEQMIEKTNKWSDVEAKLRYDSAHPKMSWWRFPRVMVPEFFRAYIKEKGYRNGTAGFIESMYQAYSMFITYAKLWELQNKR